MSPVTSIPVFGISVAIEVTSFLLNANNDAAFFACRRSHPSSWRGAACDTSFRGFTGVVTNHVVTNQLSADVLVASQRSPSDDGTTSSRRCQSDGGQTSHSCRFNEFITTWS